MEEWTDSVRIAVDIFVACVIIGALLLCITLGHKISNYMDANQAAAEDVREFRTANAYEGTTVYSQDVINLILTNQGLPAVEVTYTKNGATRTSTWSLTEDPGVEMTTAALGAEIGVAKSFICTLEYSNDGGINTYQFVEVTT